MNITDTISEKIDSVDNNVNVILPMIDNIVKKHTSVIDDIMRGIYSDIISVDEPATDTIEKYFVTLTNALYFVCADTEYLAMYDGISKSTYKEAYNNALLTVNDGADKSSKKSVAEVTATAENATIYDQTVNDMYNKAYKIVKSKIESAQTMVSTLSKILSKRMNEMQMSNSRYFGTDDAQMSPFNN